MSYSNKSTVAISALINKLFNTFSASADVLIMQITANAIIDHDDQHSVLKNFEINASNKDKLPDSNEQLLMAFGLPTNIIEKNKLTQQGTPAVGPSIDMAISMNANLCTLGYCFSQQTINTLSFLPPSAFKKIYPIIKEIKKNQASHVSMRPLFPGFPDISEAERQSLDTLQQIHYQNNLLISNANPTLGGNANPTAAALGVSPATANDELLFANTVLNLATSNIKTKQNKPSFDHSNIKTLKFQGPDFLFKKLFEQIVDKNPNSPEKAANLGILMFVCNHIDERLTKTTLEKALSNAKHKENIAIAKAWVYTLSQLHLSFDFTQEQINSINNTTNSNLPTSNVDENLKNKNLFTPPFDDEFVQKILLSTDTPIDVMRCARLISAIFNENKNLIKQNRTILANQKKSAKLSPTHISKNHSGSLSTTAAMLEVDNDASPLNGINTNNVISIELFSRELLKLSTHLASKNALTQAQTLHEQVKLFSFKRPLRRLFLQILDNHAKRQPEQQRENLFSQREQFLRLAEIIHPGQYKTAFPNTFEAFKDLQDNKPPINFEYKFEQLFKSNPQKAFDHLCGRPGVFGRTLMRSFKKIISNGQLNQNPQSWEKVTQNIDILKSSLKLIVQTIPTQLLLQLDTHLDNLSTLSNKELANELSNNRTKAFLPKAATVSPFLKKADDSFTQNQKNLNKFKTFSVHIKNIDQELKEFQKIIQQEFSLRCQHNSKNHFNTCYIDPILKNINVPFSVRTNNTSTKTLALGSAIPIDSFLSPVQRAADKKQKQPDDRIRMFLYWNESGTDASGNKVTIDRTDIDLACILFDKNFSKLSSCSFSSYNNPSGIEHSGDFVCAPDGAAEFIDIKLNELDDDVAYISMTINNFNGIAYNEIPQCFAGIQINPQETLVDPKAVAFKVDLNSKSYSNMPAFLDVKNKKFYWADVSLSKSIGYDLANSKSKTVSMLTQSICSLVRPNLYDLFYNYATSIGATILNTPQDADIHFCLFAPGSSATNTATSTANSINKNNQHKKIMPEQQQNETKVISAFDIATIQEQFLVDGTTTPQAQLNTQISTKNSTPKIK